MKSIVVVSAAMTGAALSSTFAPAAEIAIVRDGKPASVIVLEADAADACRRSARDFQCQIHAISGASLSIISPAQLDSGFQDLPIPVRPPPSTQSVTSSTRIWA